MYSDVDCEQPYLSIVRVMIYGSNFASKYLTITLKCEYRNMLVGPHQRCLWKDLGVQGLVV